MTSLRILVLGSHSFSRTILVKILQRLGINVVLQACDSEDAMLRLHLQGGVDILVCDLMDRGLDSLQFLHCASHAGMVRAVVLCSELQPELRRTLEQMGRLAGLPLLAVISHPISKRSLSDLLQDYSVSLTYPGTVHAHKELPSEDDVRRGLALGEFRAWYQPQFHLRSGAVVGIEALVRWEHPTRGVMLPCDFLAAVVAYDLDNQMLKQLLEQGLGILGILRRQGIALTLAFNLHASQLRNRDLVELIECALDHHAFKGTALTFELAENGLLNCSRNIQVNLLRLRLLGCNLSIDDFGVGFTSLKFLGQSPFNQLKLDGLFVQNLDRLRDRTMVLSTLALTRTLGMNLMIEGVSSVIIRDHLLELGCDTGQGFYLARPMNGHDLLRWLLRHFAEH